MRIGHDHFGFHHHRHHRVHRDHRIARQNAEADVRALENRAHDARLAADYYTSEVGKAKRGLLRLRGIHCVEPLEKSESGEEARTASSAPETRPYAVMPVGVIPPDAPDAPLPPAPAQVTTPPHVTNVGSVVDVMA